ncbi:PREDICTED: zinc finger C2HC domain-containing protein 1A-like [Branchiostoma belcheri]|uniref:Zinc finger C2HC domain-containing protein 1A n=1 Tax=Branchiostoma belcheri TaxID=7741 RepID=A0A6P4YVW0_BRABE|nr:PREDICTED: zinc finger C2HC domain-containing protein 1A-like [Branchiostoma belcheri]
MADQYEAFRASSMDNLQPCSTCGRTFVPEVLVKHTRICQKNAQKKRKVFDSGRMRAQGTDIPVNKTQRTQPLGTQPKTTPTNSKQSKWRQQHEDFIRSIRAAKETDVAIKTGKPLPPPPPPAINPDYVQCPHCEKRFNETAAERHIPWCAEQTKRIPNKKNQDAKSRMNARTQYRAPLPGKKKAAANSTSRMTSTANSAQSRGVSSGYGAQNGARRMPGATSLSNGSSAATARSAANRGPAAGGKGRSQYGYQNYDNDSDNDDSYDRRESSPLDHGRGVMLRTGRVNNSPPVRQANQRPANRSSPANAARRGNSGLMGGMNSRTPTPPSVNRGRPPSGPSSATRRKNPAANHMSANSRYDDYDEYDYQSTGDLPERLTQAMRLGSTENIAGKTASKFCHECGTRYPVPNAKFCCECGTRRIWLM